MQQDSKQIIKGLPRRIALMLLDCGLIVLCYWLAVMLRFDSGDAYKRVLRSEERRVGKECASMYCRSI